MKKNPVLQLSNVFQSRAVRIRSTIITIYRSIGLNVIVKYKYIDEQRENGKIHTYQKNVCLFLL